MRPHSRGLVAGAVLLALAAGGCSRDVGGRSADEQIKELRAYDINPVARDRVKNGGTLRWPINELPSQWNYFHLNGTKLETLKVLRSVMPMIFRTDEKAVSRPNPDYLSDARVTAKPKQVVRLTINPKARWSDGSPITYKDFVAVWKASSGKDKRFQISAANGYNQIASVAAGKDERQVVITFAKPFADWQSLFSPLYPAKEISDPDAFNKGWLGKILLTGGPFKLEGIDKTAKTITVVRDDKWWGPPAKLDRIVFRAMGEDAMANAFANGEIDIVDVGANSSSYRRARTVRGVAVRKAAGPDYRQITLNGRSEMLSDVKVREAVARGINRQAIAQSDLQDLDWPVQTLNNHFLMNTQEGYQDNAGNVGKYDQAEAKRLLDAAGWKQSGEYRQKDGKPLALRFVIPAEIPVSKREGELVQAMLKDLGIKVDIQAVPSDDFFDKYIIPGNFDLVPFSWIGTPFPVSQARSVYAEPVKDSKGELHIQQNFARIGASQIDEAMDKAIAELDPAKARQYVNEADKLVWQEIHSITLYQRPEINPTRANLANIGAFGFYEPVYEDIGFVS